MQNFFQENVVEQKKKCSITFFFMLSNTRKYLTIKYLYSIFVIETNHKTNTMSKGYEYYKMVEADILAYMRSESIREYGNDDLPELNHYFLSIENDGRYRAKVALITYGGPNVLIRFFENGIIEFEYAWGYDEYRRDITGEPWAKWLRDYLCIDEC